jgi:transposase
MKAIIVTQKNRLKLSSKKLEIVKQLSYYSARLYNVGLYSVKQYYFNNNAYLNYAKNYHECKANENYKLLLSDTSQQILRIVDRNFKSFFGLLKLKAQGKYTEKVRIPHYKKQDELMNITIQGRSARIRKGYVIIGLSKAFKAKHNPPFNELKFKLPKNITVDKLQEVRILPVFNGLEFDIEFVYKKEFEPISVDKNNYLSIDMGLDNFATCFNSNDGSSFIIDGRYIKSINRHYNKQILIDKA